ncbi:kinetochore protein Spc25 isoform X2 [Eurosta solidaginis]|uniref:kinetochore protein Spc25 isoform X2 n=1 Tax=Eurosta solidaginis TaxID=178769 RepID=UPI003531457F
MVADVVDYAKRLEKMINRDITLEKRETKLTKAHFKYREKLEEVEQRYHKQNQGFSEITNFIDKLKEANEKREKLLEEGMVVMSQIEAAVKQHRAIADYYSQQLYDELEEIQNTKLATNTYINLKALPARVQGVAIIEMDDRRIWQPFCVEPLSHSPEELKQIIWANSKNAAEYSEAWEQLLFRPLREMKKQ